MCIVHVSLKVLSHCGTGKTFPILLRQLVRSCLRKHAKRKKEKILWRVLKFVRPSQI